MASARLSALLALAVKVRTARSINRELRDLIRQVSTANPLWGAPRIHGELLKLGIEVSQATVAKYMVRRPRMHRIDVFLVIHADDEGSGRDSHPGRRIRIPNSNRIHEYAATLRGLHDVVSRR